MVSRRDGKIHSLDRRQGERDPATRFRSWKMKILSTLISKMKLKESSKGHRFTRLSLCLCVLCGNDLLRLTFAGDVSPEAELASFQIASGFDVNLFASEVDGVLKPIQIRFDPQ